MTHTTMTLSGDVTVDELARAAGMTVRNVRAHQNRGLLPPPRIEGRTGYYSQAHLARLRRISELQERGYSLAAIADVLEEEAGGGGHSETGLTALAEVPHATEAPVILNAEEVASRLALVGEDVDLIGRLVQAGLAERLGDGGIRIPSPAVLESGEAFIHAGADPERTIALQERMRDTLAALAADILKVAHQEVLLPSLAAAEGEEDVLHVVQLMLGLRPLAVKAAVALLQQGFDDALRDMTAPPQT